MGRKPAATREKVLAAVRKLQRAGGLQQTISARKIRAEIGSGSLSTISDILKTLENERPDLFPKEIARDQETPSQEIQEFVNDLKQKIDFIPQLFRMTSLSDVQQEEGEPRGDWKALQKEVQDLKNIVESKNREIQDLKDQIKIMEGQIKTASENDGQDPLETPEVMLNDKLEEKHTTTKVQEDETRPEIETSGSVQKRKPKQSTRSSQDKTNPKKPDEPDGDSQLSLF